MATGDGQLWPEVTSPVARRVLTHLFNMQDCQTDSSEVSGYGRDFSSQDLEYAQWVRSRLRSSMLAKRLTASPDAIPDISDAGTVPYARRRSTLQLRTIEELVDYLVINLDWILQPTEQPLWTSKINWIWVFVIASLIMSITEAFMRLGHASAITWVITIASATLYVISRLGRDKRGCSFLFHRLINATELYWYLRQEYSDSGFPDAQLPDPSHPHIK